jgi:hypothetical protein
VDAAGTMWQVLASFPLCSTELSNVADDLFLTRSLVWSVSQTNLGNQHLVF